MGLFRFLSILLINVMIFSCSAPPKPTDSEVKRPEKSVPTAHIDKKVDYLKEAQEVFARTGSISKRDELLLKAADVYNQQDDCEKALKILSILSPTLQDKEQQNISQILSIECLLKIDTAEVAEHSDLLLSKLKIVPDYESRVYKLRANLYSLQHEWIKASEALLKSVGDDVEKSQQIWLWLKNLTPKELRAEQLRNTPLSPWLQLSLIIHTYGLKPELLAEQVTNWQQRLPEHILAKNLPHEVILSLELKPMPAKRIAVLLPLSGRLASQGQALKEGILAAYLAKLSEEQASNFKLQSSNNQGSVVPGNLMSRQLRFFDSALKSTEELNALVTDYDFVIGPLLKENIDGLKAVLPADKVMLALNRSESDSPLSLPLAKEQQPVIDHVQPDKEHYFFALAPEDEAEQLAQYIKHKGFKRPIVFAADNSVTKRMAETFVSKWSNDLTKPRKPDVAIFSDSKDMRTQVESLLNVAQSEARIRQMENLADIEVYSVERNRKDVDVIVLFANPEQTELLNPMIEASLSPSAHGLAVFASSRSYSLELTKNSLRDLRNLTFSDMPWMLPDHQWRDLANETNALWPQRLDSLLRLFAMGYDAYELIDSVRQLKALPQIHKSGLTGELTVSDNGVLHRHLPFAKITQDRVSLLAVD